MSLYVPLLQNSFVPPIINHYSRCGFGKGSLFSYTCHLTQQSMPQLRLDLSIWINLHSLHSLVCIWEGLDSVNTHKTQLGELGRLVTNTRVVCVCNGSANASKMHSGPHSVHTKSFVMHNALWWILGKNVVFGDDISWAELPVWLCFFQPSLLYSNIQIKPGTLTTEHHSA